MKEYAEYKETRKYEWYGKIPKDWKIGKVRQLFKLRKEKNYKPLEDVNLLSLYTEFGVIQNGEVEYNSGNKAVSADGYKVVHKNDIVVNIILSWMGAIGLSNFDGVTSPAYDVYEPINLNEINPVYFHHLFRTKAFSGECFKKGRGIMLMRWRTYSPEFKSISIPIPPISEQNAIVEYLDKKTKQIDEFVSAKEKEIAALKELKKTLVADAVTKGISNEELVDTELYWYSKKPKSWNLKRAKYIYKKENRSVKSNYETVTCFRDGEVTLRKNRRTTGFTESLQENGYQGVMYGDLVIHIMDAFAGSIGVSDSEGKCTPVYSVCTPKIPNINNYFYAYFLRYMALSGYIVSLSKGIRERSSDFRFEIFANQILPVPPLSEQNAIVEFLDKKTVDIDTMLSSTQKQIDLVKELRTKIIADAVTGKVDVRK